MPDEAEGLAEILAAARKGMRLPPGAWLSFTAVRAAVPDQLPPAAERWAAPRRDSFAAGRRAATEALRAAGFSGNTRIPIGQGGLPEWPNGWTGSISHTAEVAGALVAPSTPTALSLGFDIERIMPPHTAAELAPTILPGETFGHTALLPEEELTRAFSAKEALYKALFPSTRQFRGFEAARIVWTESRNEIGLELTEDWGADWPSGTRLVALQISAASHIVTILCDQASRSCGTPV